MFDNRIGVAADVRTVLDRARTARCTELAAAAEQLVTAAQWADLHPVPHGAEPAGWGDVDLHGEGRVPLAGQGTPEVAEFAPAELAAHLGISHDAGRQLIGDALELRHRLPRLFDLVLGGVVPAWRARQAASLTPPLTPEMVTWVDKMLTCDPGHLTQVRISRIIEETILHYDPDRAAAAEQSALAARHVTLVHDTGPATTEVHMCLDTLDALHLDDTLTDLATTLRHLGDTDPLEIRRAKAVGVLADPQTALHLLEGHHPEQPDAPGERRAGRVELFVHLDATDLTDLGRASTDIERLGAATGHLLRDWLARPGTGPVTVRPVLDLHDERAVDQHDPPAWMRTAAILADATCVFPGCTRDSRHADLDHITPYRPMNSGSGGGPAEGGPPGQTRLANLAPLCRTHHRIKTHTNWDYVRLADNSYLWTTPHGDPVTVRTRRRRT